MHQQKIGKMTEDYDQLSYAIFNTKVYIIQLSEIVQANNTKTIVVLALM